MNHEPNLFEQETLHRLAHPEVPDLTPEEQKPHEIRSFAAALFTMAQSHTLIRVEIDPASGKYVYIFASAAKVTKRQYFEACERIEKAQRAAQREAGIEPRPRLPKSVRS